MSHRSTTVLAAVALALAAALPLAATGAAAAPAQTPPDGSVSPAVAAQIAAIEAEKASRTPAEQKVDSNLLYAVNDAATGVAVPGVASLQSTTEVVKGRVAVDIDGEIGPDLLGAIGAAGGKVIASVPAFGSVRATVPLDAVVGLAGRPDVRGVRPADEATTNRATGGDDATTASVGNGLSEADVTHGAATARSTYGVDGTGVKVCVLSDGVTSLAARQASGDLPAVDVLPGQSGTGDEGTAMLELIHDIAPGAELGFATAFTSVASFAQNILDLRTDGCDVIVDDVTYYSETTFQDGPIAQAITTVRTAGAVYFSSAGNSGNLADGTSGTWQGDFDDEQTSGSPLPLGLRLHGWGQSGITYNTITKTGGPLNLQWSDPVGASSNDYDLYLLNAAGTNITASSTNVQNGTQNPAESVSTSPSGGRVVVSKPVAAASRYLVLYTNRGTLTYGTGGSARGHNASVDAVSVAATPAKNAFGSGSPTGPYPSQHSTANQSELFSSDGPVKQFFTPAGVALTPGNFSASGGITRNGPDLTAADGVTTTTPGFIPFFGTSAAAPNAAALAALALEAKPALTPTQLEGAMGSAALDIETAGLDNVAGAGIVMANPLLSVIGAPTKARLTAGNRTVTPQTGDGDSYLEPGETATVTQLLANVGAAAATGISATLTSDSANATVTNGTVTYANIAAGATGSPNTLPLRISVAAGCPCGTTLPFTLTVSYTGGSQPTVSIPINIATGEPTPVNDVLYAGSVVPIPDNSTTGASATLSVASTAKVRSLTFSIGGSACNTTSGSSTVGIDHSYVGDLKLSLTSPSGTTVLLMSGVGAAGRNICQTVFSDSAASNIQDQTAAAAPFTGSFRPAEPLSAFIGENPAGTWTLKAVDGAGTDVGNIRAFSLQLTSSQCTIPNRAPVGTADAYSTGQGQTLNQAAPGVLGNDSDPDGNAITAAIVANPTHGNVTLNSNGSFAYTPDPAFKGNDTFTYKASDGTLASATTTVTITVNGTPTGGPESYTVPWLATFNQPAPGVLGNDSDPEGNPITAQLVTTVSHGSLTLNSNGSFSYTPTGGYFGSDSFTYKVSDGTTASAPITVSFVVNAPPSAAADSYGVVAGAGTLNVAAPGVLGNDTDPEGNALTAVLGATVSHGTLTLNSNGSFSYTPTGGYTGTDSFTYRAKDAWGQSSLATVTLTVSASNTAPTAGNDTYFTSRATALTVPTPGVLGNDTDAQGDSLTAVLVSGPASGTLGLNSNGSFTYTPTATFSGTATFTYKAFDGNLSSGTATVSIRVNGAPTGVADAYNVGYQTLLSVPAPGILGNDTDPDGDSLTAQLGANVSHGSLTLNANGSFSYTPANGYSGTDSFTYRAKDADGQSALTTVTLTVAPEGNQAPTAVADTYRTVKGKAITATAPGVLGNDTDPDADGLTAVLVATSANGTLGLQANGSFTYTPNATFTGIDSFTYQASDGTASSSTVTVKLEVLTPNEAYVSAIYLDFLTRTSEPGGLAYWAGRLDRGVETRTSFVLKMSRSHEYGVKIVTRAFNDVLGRNPDPSGREYWANKVQKGMPVSDLVLNLIASDEFLRKTGGTNAGFVTATYQAILGRAPSSAELAAKVAQINGGTKRLTVASDLYKTAESRQRRVKVQFVDLLGRQPTATELSSWVAQLATKSDIDLAIALGASTEYYNASQVL